MDGSPKDRIVNGRLFRPASLSRAVDQYPDVVLLIFRAKARVSFQTASNGVAFVSVRGGNDPSVSVDLCASDYDRCMNVVRGLGSVPIFPSEPVADVYDRVRALIRVQFADRGAF